MNLEVESIVQPPYKSLPIMNPINSRALILALRFDTFNNAVLDYGDEAGHAHGVKAVTGMTEA